MFKTSLLNFFKSLKYYLTPLGIIAIAMAFALSVSMPGILAAPNDLFDGVSHIFTTPADWQAGWDVITSKVTSLDWKNSLPLSVQTVFNKTWLTTTLKEAVLAMYSSESEISAEIATLIVKCINSILSSILWGLLILVAGFIVGYILLKIQIKTALVKGKKLSRAVIISLIKILLDVGIMVLSVYLTSVWVWSIFIAIGVFILVNGLGSLIEAYYAIGYKKIKFKEVVNFKNIVLLYITTILIYLIGIGFVVGVAFLINNFVGLFLGLPLLEITLVVVGINSEAYVRHVVEEKENVALLVATAMVINSDETVEEKATGEESVEDKVEGIAEEIREEDLNSDKEPEKQEETLTEEPAPEEQAIEQPEESQKEDEPVLPTDSEESKE